MRKVSNHMGMPISIDIPDCKYDSIFNECWQLLNVIDEQFSPYKPHSEVSRIADGRLDKDHASDNMKTILKLSKNYNKHTNGYFSLYFNGGFDPSGIVKSWAIKQVELLITRHGFNKYMVNAGGDIACHSDKENYWNIGIQNPNYPNKLIGTIRADTTAVATSGNYQKGSHIYDPLTKTSKNDLKSITVIGMDIISTDVYATALFAMGYKAIEFAKKLKGYRFIIVDNYDYVYSV